jgi:hypothetical protein
MYHCPTHLLQRGAGGGQVGQLAAQLALMLHQRVQLGLHKVVLEEGVQVDWPLSGPVVNAHTLSRSFISSSSRFFSVLVSCSCFICDGGEAEGVEPSGGTRD